jgi:hypothetical protein
MRFPDKGIYETNGECKLEVVYTSPARAMGLNEPLRENKGHILGIETDHLGNETQRWYYTDGRCEDTNRQNDINLGKK